jgi:putative acetyltransferase
MTGSSAPQPPETPEAPEALEALHIRPFRTGDEAALRDVFFASVHVLASRNYSPAQLAAWAPLAYDAAAWAARLEANQPFVAEIGGRPVGFADVQPSGYIDQFFVNGAHAGLGVGQALMAHIFEEATRRGITSLSAQVSLRAEPFFTRHGFELEARQVVERQGVLLRNARMRRVLPP